MQKTTARVAGAIVLGITLAGAALGWTLVKRPLPVPAEPITELPAVRGVEGVTLSVLPTARIETQHGFSVRGAPLTAPLVSAMATFVVTHPRGLVLIDAGMGRNGVAHLSTTPWLLQALAELEVSRGTADALRDRGVRDDELAGVILTHAHWDHVSGLQDLPDIPVWLTAEELAYARTDPGALLYRQIDAERRIDVREIRFDDGPYGPFSSSDDLFGDGSLVLVPMAGHTPGSVGVFVNLPTGQRYLFIGDTAWAREGVDWPAEKPWLTRRLVDLDAQGVRDQLVLLHRLQDAEPELVIVPAHDERVHDTLPRFR